MASLRTRVATALLSALLGFAAGPAQAAEWKRLDSEHMTTYAQLRENKAREFVTQLELLHGLTMRLIGAGAVPSLPAKAPLEVFLHGAAPRTVDSDTQMRATYYPGTDRECLEVAGLDTAFNTGREEGTSREQQLVQEILVLRLMMRHAPMSFPQRWYAKGFARYLAATEHIDGNLYLGSVHLQARSELNSGRWVPYESVLRSGTGADSPSTLDEDRFNAQSWLLVHYLMSSATGKRQLADYLERWAKGEDSVAAFEAATGRKLPEWDRVLQDYRKTRFTLARVRPDLLPKVVIRTTAIDPQTLRYIDLRRRLHWPSSTPQEGQALRRELQARVAGVEAPGIELKLDLARADLLAGDTAAATAKLEALAQEARASGEVHLLLGRVHRQQAATMKGDEQRARLERANEQLQKALRLLPTQASAHHEHARVLAELGQPALAVAASREARRLDPANWKFAMLDASLALQTDDRQGAVEALETLAYQPWWPDTARRFTAAIAAIAAIQAGKSAADVQLLLDANNSPPKSEPRSDAAPPTTPRPPAG